MHTLVQTVQHQITYRIRHIGKTPFLCNANPHHSIHLGGVCLPLCSRCTGIAVGLTITHYLILWTGLVAYSLMTTCIAALALLPCAIDGIAQYYFNKQSTNPRRAITGLLCGAGACLLIRAIKGA